MREVGVRNAGRVPLRPHEAEPLPRRAPSLDDVTLYTYLNYGGNCRAAFTFYAEHLGGRITMMTTHGEGPNADRVPPAWRDAVVHARIEVGGTTVFGADISPDRFQPMRSAYLSLLVDSVDEAERLYALLTEGGEVFMPMAETPFARRFAMLRDRFGTSWMLLHEAAREAAPEAAPIPAMAELEQGVPRAVTERVPGPDGTYDLAEVDERPELTNRSEVDRLMQRNYPPLLRDAGIAGQVTLRFRVNEDGRVDAESIAVENASHDAFGDAARRVVERMRFRPATVGGRAVRVWVTLPITFHQPS